MIRRTIDFGIDLGTTNSSIAVWTGSDVRFFRNDGREITPSAVYIQSNGALLVGERAWQQLGADPENAKGELSCRWASRPAICLVPLAAS